MSEVKPVEPLDYGSGSLIPGEQIGPNLNWFAIGAVALVLATIAFYSPTLRGTFLWDDGLHLTQNTQLNDSGGLQNIWFKPGATPQYYPLTYTMFWLERKIWGLDSAGYKFVNILLHAASAILVWVILRRLRLAGAAVIAAVFALHPVQLESVGWIKERSNVLSTALYLSAALVYLRYCGLTPARESALGEKPSMFSLPKEKEHLYGLAVTFFVLALLAKSIACTFPIAILLLIYWRRGRVGFADVVPLLPFFALGLAAGAVTIYFENHNLIAGLAPEWDYAPTMAGEIGYRIAVAGRAIWFYAGKLLFPYPLVFIYPRWSINPASPLQYLPAVLVLVALGVLWAFRRTIGRGPFVAMTFFVFSLLPVSGLLNVASMRYSFVADHYQYLASLGFIALVVGSVAEGLKRIEVSQHVNLSAGRYVMSGVVIVLLGSLTAIRGPVFTSNGKLCKDTLVHNPDAWAAGVAYANYLSSTNELEAAQGWYRRVVKKLNPASVEARMGLASVAMKERKPEEAVKWLQEAVTQPEDSPDAKYELARTLESTGDLDGALKWFTVVANEDPKKAFGLPTLMQEAHMRVAAIHMVRGDLASAMKEYQDVLNANPLYVPAQAGLGEALGKAGQTKEALAAFAQAMQLAPKDYDVHLSLSRFLVAIGRFDDARGTLVKATRLVPQRLEAYLGIGEIELKLGRPKEAVEVYDFAANTVAPRSRAAREGLAKAKLVLAASTQPSTRSATQPSTRAATAPATQDVVQSNSRSATQETDVAPAPR